MYIKKDNYGTYIIILTLKKYLEIGIGKLGIINFKAGFYAYVGSAFGRGGLKSRLKHHLKIAQKPHWHIDYFRKYAKIEKIWFTNSQHRLEHEWAETLSLMPGVTDQINGFGSSDCSCISHFFYFKKIPSILIFKRTAQRNKNYDTFEIDLSKRKDLSM